jgi:hypothetical protein
MFLSVVSERQVVGGAFVDIRNLGCLDWSLLRRRPLVGLGRLLVGLGLLLGRRLGRCRRVVALLAEKLETVHYHFGRVVLLASLIGP